MAGDKIVQITSDNWQSEVLESGIAVLVDFWAEWCGPCRAMNPILEALSTSLDGKLKIAKVNVDTNQNLASQFGVRSIPTMLVFKNGAVQEQMVGSMNRAALEQKLSAYL